jgi:hypothetical protein
MAIGQNNDGISSNCQSGGSTIQTDFTTLTLNGIGSKASTVIEIQHMYLLIGEDISFLHEFPVDSDTALVVNVDFGNVGSMDFAFEHYSH